MHEIRCCDVKKELGKLKNKCNTDVLGMEAKLLHLSADVVSPILTCLYNASIETSTVPSDWQFARVSPVYKSKGCKLDKNNYRPISVISHIAKIFERLIQAQLMEYLIKNEYISIDQSAYRKYHNTQTCLHRVVDDWLDNIGDNVFTGVCLLDIRKCFDSISHSILCDKLSYYGICGKENDFFKSYLSNRTQVVKYGTITSDIENINVGVPQGSVLGPILFMLFINDISQHIHLGTCNLYADDCLIYCTGNSVDDVSNKLQQSVNDISDWYNGNDLLLNVDKCNTMLIGSKHKFLHLNGNDELNISLHNISVSQVDVVKYLGVTLEKSLSWDYHVNDVCSKLSKKVGMLARIRKSTPHEILLKIYNSVVQPTIDYCLTVWGNTTTCNLNKIQRIQNYAARIMTNEFDYINVRGIELVKRLGWMSVKQRFNYFCLLLMFKCIHGQAPDYLCNNVVMECEVQLRQTRSSDYNNVYVPFATNETVTKTLMFTGAVLWNSLPHHVQDITSLNTFKSKARQHVMVL